MEHGDWGYVLISMLLLTFIRCLTDDAAKGAAGQAACENRYHLPGFRQSPSLKKN